MKNIIILRADDWEALVVDGKVLIENHCLQPSEVLEALKIKFKTEFMPDDEDYEIWSKQFIK